MVTPTCYSPADVRRYSRMNGYSSYPERRSLAYPIHPDTRTTIMAERDMIDDVTPQRKRIAVACGRCRKRKIRCSGDSGNGGPCTNCKNAGYEPCQFLRVASQETPMKQESFNYSLEASRQYQARGSSVVPPLPPATSHYPDGLPMNTSDPFVYRAPTTFAYTAKSLYPLSNWSNGYTEDQGINYTMYPPAYPSVHDSDYGINYRIGSGTVGKSEGICVDTEPNYAYSSGPPTTSLVHRPAPVAADSTSMTFQNMAAGVNMGDRVLPMPVGRSSVPNSIGPSSSSYRNESSCSSVFGSGGRGSSAQTSTTAGTSPASPDSETPSSYTSYEPSSVASAAGLSSYPPITLASQLSRTSNDLYTHASSSEASLYSPADSMRVGGGGGPGPDLTYRYTDTTTAATTAAATTSARRELPMMNGGSGSVGSSFSMAHGATTYMAQPASYMLPPGDVGGTGAEAAADSYRKTAGTLRG
ncbi:hypothetical protein LCI18_004570 [Fusarium solani-melongenae]|uniref:Uncharacterized protein n=1 Tax=Fusarium solani subsp. cucurbitae TaxID=2747967 RepID=A0ACD3YXI0_FUSSC|nr:hypothetical protein LCI18_004570 [Fusarium solani-melongenae]